MFKDRQEAGELLAQKLVSVIKDEDIVVLGIPRGGVVVAKEVARRFDAPLDIVVVKKIGAPTNAEMAIGAVGPEKTVYWDEQLCQRLGLNSKEKQTLRQQTAKEQKRREQVFAAVRKKVMLLNAIVVLVDDGIATGATVLAAALYLRKQAITKLILAVPVIATDTYRDIAHYFDIVVSLHVAEEFHAVGQFYRKFEQVSDDEVIEILKSKD